jgi:hypothetical protein
LAQFILFQALTHAKIIRLGKFLLTHNTFSRTVVITHSQNALSLRFDLFVHSDLAILIWSTGFNGWILFHSLLADDFEAILTVGTAYFLE